MRDKTLHEPGTYLLDYPYKGGLYSLDLYADSLQDAEDRLQAIVNYGKIEGGPSFSIPAVPGAGLWVRLFCWWKNRKGAA